MLNVSDWDPVSVEDAAALMRGAPAAWWIAGGWALDLFLGETTRQHGDTDILILRRDQLAVQSHLAAWDLFKTKQPGLAPWPRGEFLAPPINDVWARRADGPWLFQLMLMETDGNSWDFRRQPSIGGAVADLGLRTATGIPYLRPEIQLLYKARADYREKDLADLERVLPHLSPAAAAWLLACLELLHPDGHDWIARLRAALDYPQANGA